MGKRVGTIPSAEGRRFYWCRKANVVMFILKGVFDFQSSSPNICFLVMLVNSSLGHRVARGSVQRSLCPVSTSQRCETQDRGGISSGIRVPAPFYSGSIYVIFLNNSMFPFVCFLCLVNRIISIGF